MKKVYIKDFSLYIPETFVDSKAISKETGIPEEIVRTKLGIVNKPVENKLSLSEMSLKPIQDLIEKGIVRREDVRFLISAGSDYKDRYIWTMAPKLLENIGVKSALGFDLSAQCVGSLVALDMAKGKMLSLGEGTGIISVATKQSKVVNYKDPASSFMYDFSDGSVAIALSTEGGEYEILGGSFISDGSFSDVVYSEIGERYSGSVKPNYQFLRVDNDPDWKERMGMVSEVNFMRVMRESLERSSIGQGDLSYLAFLHTKRSFYSKVMDNLGLSSDKSIYLEEYGHMQGVDPFLSLRLAEEAGKIHDGDYILLVSSGTGWTWGAVTLRAKY